MYLEFTICTDFVENSTYAPKVVETEAIRVEVEFTYGA